MVAGIFHQAKLIYSERQAIAQHPQELSLIMIRIAQKFHYRPQHDKYSYVVAKKIAGVSLGISKILVDLEQAKQLASFIKLHWLDRLAA
jgi:hypothetical protein